MLQFSAIAKAQQDNIADSLEYYFNGIKGDKKNDSLFFNHAINILYKNKKNILVQNSSINEAIDHLKTILDDKHYYDLIISFYMSHFELDSIPNDALINYGKKIIKKNYGKSSIYGEYAILYLLREMRIPYRTSNRIYEGIEYFNGLKNDFLARNDSEAVSIAYNVLSIFYNRLGLNEKAEYNMLKSLEFLDNRQFSGEYKIAPTFLGKAGKVNRYSVLGSYLIDEGKPKEAEIYLSEAIKIYLALDSPMLVRDAPYLFLQKARSKTLLHSDSSSYFYDVTLHYLSLYKASPVNYAHYYMEKGKDFLSHQALDSADFYIRKSKLLKDSLHLPVVSYAGELIPHYYLAAIKIKQNKPQEAIQYLLTEMKELKQANARLELTWELKLLAEAYSAAGLDSEGFKTMQELLLLNEKLHGEEVNAKSISFDIEKKMQENDINIAVLNGQNKSNIKIKYYLFGIAALLGLFAITLGIAIFNKQKSNARLIIKNNETSQALEKLKETQAQLIQAEKMASLGELTAGIAHEIQNPLNFVNNFSEINTELIEEMKVELKAGNKEDAIALANDIADNEQKINHHGKRADAIVKGMLQHSRNSSSAAKEPTDVNKLADEYLRLAYHGLRAKDKSFNATMKTDFDETIVNINIIPQDIGRVILNLITNAFYAVDEKKKSGIANYTPTVTVATKKINDKTEIRVTDNGNGILENVIDKIFQPFFTTKPTGQGTGLGLSMSYDIVKAHGGELKVETKAQTATTFTIVLPSAI